MVRRLADTLADTALPAAASSRWVRGENGVWTSYTSIDGNAVDDRVLLHGFDLL